MATKKIKKPVKNLKIAKKVSKKIVKKTPAKNIIKTSKKNTATKNKKIVINKKTSATKNKAALTKGKTSNFKQIKKQASVQKNKVTTSKLKPKIKNKVLSKKKVSVQKNKVVAKKINNQTLKVAKKVEVKTLAKKIVKSVKIEKENTPAPVKANKAKAEEGKKTEIVAAKTPTKNSKTSDFKAGEYVVYPSHGIGKVVDIQKTTILGSDFSCYLMHFEKEKLTIKVPLANAEKIGLRPLASKAQMDEVFSILRSGIKKLKGMWSRRAQEYESKINSGNIILLAEVLRDLTRDIEDGDRSYSERIIYETAVLRLAAEYSTIYKVDFEDAKNKVIAVAKDKLGSDEKSEKPKKDDDFDFEDKDSSGDDAGDDEAEEDLEEEEDEDEDDYDDDDDDKPRKKRKK